MGLDVYVGPLCRYYAGDWDTILEQAAPELGIEVQSMRPDEPEDELSDASEMLEAILAWRAQLADALAEHGVTLTWPEELTGPYFTDKPSWDCYGDLLLWAAYHEHPEMTRPVESVEDWPEDPALLASNAPDFPTSFPNLLKGAEFWLPADFDFLFGAPDPTGTDAGFGSSYRLLEELRALNSETFQASKTQFETWRRDGSEPGAPLETGARFGLALLTALAEKSVEHSLPMKLDY